MTEYFQVDLGDLQIDISISSSDNNHGKININKEEIIKMKVKEQLKTSHYWLITSSLSNNDIIDIYGVDPLTDGFDKAIDMVWRKSNPKYKILNVTSIPVCEGCRYNEPNQLSHMGEHGCLEVR